MKKGKRLAALTVLAALLLALTSCMSSPLAEYTVAAAKNMTYNTYRETIAMSATATLEGTNIRVAITTELDCVGNTGATFEATGAGKSVVGADYLEEDMISPFKIYIRNGYYYYDYENYFEDGSNYQYKIRLDYTGEDAISDLLPVAYSDVEEGTVEKNDNGGKVITMAIKDALIEDLMMDAAIEPMNMMLFGEDTYTLTYRDFTIVTTLDSDGRATQSTATVTGTGEYYGSYLSIVYVYDVTYYDFDEIIHLVFPDGIESYEELSAG